MRKSFYTIALLFAASTLFIGCGSDDPTPEPPPPPPQVEAITLTVSDLTQLYNTRPQTQNQNRKYQINITGNIRVNAQNITQLSVFGEWARAENVTVNWGDNVVVPDGLVRISFNQHQNEFGRVPLGAGFTGASADDVARFANIGITVLARFGGENVSIANADELSGWFYTIQDFVTNENNGAPVDVSFDEVLHGGVRGLAVKNAHMPYLSQIGRYATIANANLTPAELDVYAELETLQQFTIIGNGTRGMDGNMFKISGLSDECLATLNANGEFLRTDTASLSRILYQDIVPNRAFVDVHGMNAAVLKRLRDLENHTVLIEPVSDERLVGNQRALHHHTPETMTLLSPTSFNRGTPWQSARNLIITPKTNRANPTPEDFYGAIQLRMLHDMHSDWSFQLIDESIRAAGNGQFALLNPPFPNHVFYSPPLPNVTLETGINRAQILNGIHRQNAARENIWFMWGPNHSRGTPIAVPREVFLDPYRGHAYLANIMQTFFWGTGWTHVHYGTPVAKESLEPATIFCHRTFVPPTP